MNKNTSWGNVAGWYDDLVEEKGSYQRGFLLPNILRVASLSKEDKVLELGCGQGLFSHEFAKFCDSVVGVDISEELISIAKKTKYPNEKYLTADASKKIDLQENFFSKCFFILSIQNIENMNESLENASRFLKKDGKLFLILNHPSFRIPKQSDWGFDESNKKQFRKIYSYMSRKKIPIIMNPGERTKEKKEVTYSFHRPLQDYAKSLQKFGFAISRIEEWTSDKKSQKGPRQSAEDESRKEIPLFMMIEARKFFIE